MQITIHSNVNVITNSSTEIYITFTGVDNVISAVREMLILMGDKRPVEEIVNVYEAYDIDPIMDDVFEGRDTFVEFLEKEDDEEVAKLLEELIKEVEDEEADNYSRVSEIVAELIDAKSSNCVYEWAMDLTHSWTGMQKLNESHCAFSVLEPKYKSFITALVHAVERSHNYDAQYNG